MGPTSYETPCIYKEKENLFWDIHIIIARINWNSLDPCAETRKDAEMERTNLRICHHYLFTLENCASWEFGELKTVHLGIEFDSLRKFLHLIVNREFFINVSYTTLLIFNLDTYNDSS